ncbi:MAG: peptidase S8 [Bacteroidetes bacterium]|nr:MAG: peptidase S8 [Bacteroidota bacterium]
MKFKQIFLAILLSMPLLTFAQSANKAPDNWHHLDPKEGFPGISTAKMYEQLKGKKSQTVIVAVIDSGVDIEHEDLQDVIWVNEDEIPGNGVDDDKNGYVDDIHGWNFIGGKDGKNVHYDQLEITRLYVELDKKYKNKSEADLSKKEKKEYKKYKEFEKIINEKREENASNAMMYNGLLEAVNGIQLAIGKDDLTKEDLENFKSDDPMMTRAATVLASVLEKGATLEDFKKQLQGGAEYFNSQVEYYYNPEFNARTIVGDNYPNSNERYYGNNDVEGPDASHGTHVSGIIAAVRGNGIGMDGVANNVKIMSIRTVPDGDERDKDVANAIRYAVDNGAKVINMSFGKGYAYDKDVVDKAVKYAAKHDVLLVHAAGNSSENNDKTDNFPNDTYRKKGFLGLGPKKAKNWLEIGALSWKGGEDAPATFSNYGKNNVDIFSPGVDIYSTTPDNHYEHFNGTSMASPVTAGIAAVIRSYYPELTAVQVKEAILKSVVKQPGKVKTPGSGQLVPFSELCQTGGYVNAAKAIAIASKMKGKNKKAKKSGSTSGGGASGKKGKSDRA